MNDLLEFLEGEKVNLSLAHVAMEFCEWFAEEYDRHQNDTGYFLYDRSPLHLAFKADNPYWCGMFSRRLITVPLTKCDAL
jgi:hypothetical protein